MARTRATSLSRSRSGSRSSSQAMGSFPHLLYAPFYAFAARPRKTHFPGSRSLQGITGRSSDSTFGGHHDSGRRRCATCDYRTASRCRSGGPHPFPAPCVLWRTCRMVCRRGNTSCAELQRLLPSYFLRRSDIFGRDRQDFQSADWTGRTIHSKSPNEASPLSRSGTSPIPECPGV